MYSSQISPRSSKAFSISLVSPSLESAPNLRQVTMYSLQVSPRSSLLYLPIPSSNLIAHATGFIPRAMLHTVEFWRGHPYQIALATCNLTTSNSRSPAPYLNVSVSAISTSPPHSTHPNIRHIHCLSDIPKANLIGESSTRDGHSSRSEF